jgi:hypothetical protein
MLDRKSLIANLDVGDIFHAEYPNGAKCICLVLFVSEVEIESRRITSQETLVFDRHNGVEKAGDEEVLAIINSVAPLPAEFHNVFLALDRKYGAAGNDKDILERNPDFFKLSEVEKKALLFIDSHYASNPLPPV